MSYEKVLQAKSIVIGTKQTVRALRNHLVQEVIIAEDADPFLTTKAAVIAKELNIPVTYVHSMKKLGEVCGINARAATVAIKK